MTRPQLLRAFELQGLTGAASTREGDGHGHMETVHRVYPTKDQVAEENQEVEEADRRSMLRPSLLVVSVVERARAGFQYTTRHQARAATTQ